MLAPRAVKFLGGEGEGEREKEREIGGVAEEGRGEERIESEGDRRGGEEGLERKE